MSLAGSLKAAAFWFAPLRTRRCRTPAGTRRDDDVAPLCSHPPEVGSAVPSRRSTRQALGFAAREGPSKVRATYSTEQPMRRCPAQRSCVPQKETERRLLFDSSEKSAGCVAAAADSQYEFVDTGTE